VIPDEDREENRMIFKMGRGHESEVRVCDISVSRCHSLIKYKADKGRFYLEDNLSKFGTLIISKNDLIELEPNWTKAV
jgi:pSer/pThr/pTyr-binding forkhead associated (FHA) protein